MRARPRSLFGLIGALGVVYARKRPVVCLIAGGALALGLVVALARGPAAGPAAVGGLRAAVLRDGFAVHRAGSNRHRLLELDRGGASRRAYTIERPGELRAVGTQGGLAVAWQDGHKVELRLAGDDKQSSTWGNSVRQLCEGAASSDARFAVGWLEADDSVWIVHGPVGAAPRRSDDDDTDDAVPAGEDGATVAALAAPASAAHNEWCGVASAEQNVAMLWRSGDRLSILMCTKKRCGALPGTFKLPREVSLIGLGCVRDACLLATRAPSGAAHVSYVTSSGRRKWTQPLAASSPTVSIIGYGDRALAVGYAGPDGAEVLRFDAAGASTPLWRDPASHGAPALAWSSGRMLVAHYHGDQIANEVIAAPR